MRYNVWHLHPVNVIVSADHMIKAVLPVHCHKWHSIIIVKQESAISIYGLLHFLSHFLSFRQGGHTADWNYSRPSNQTIKNWHVHDIYQQIQIRIDLLLQFPEWQAWLFALWQFVRWLQFPTIDKMWFSINMVYFPSVLTLSPGLRTLLLESRLVCPLLPLPLASPPQFWMVQQIFALMPCFKRTLTLLLVLIIRIILSTYKFFPSSYAFFIISTWSSAVFAASIPPPPTMSFKEAFSKKEVLHHAPLLLLPLHTHLQVYQNCSLLEDLSIWSILFLP